MQADFCPNGAKSDQHRPNFIAFGSRLANSGRHRSNLDRIWATGAQIGDIRQTSANLSRTRPKLGRFRPSLGRLRPKSSKSGLGFTTFGRNEAEVRGILPGTGLQGLRLHFPRCRCFPRRGVSANFTSARESMRFGVLKHAGRLRPAVPVSPMFCLRGPRPVTTLGAPRLWSSSAVVRTLLGPAPSAFQSWPPACATRRRPPGRPPGRLERRVRPRLGDI